MYPVRFAPLFGSQGGENSFHLVGKGTLAIDGQIVVRGNSKRLFRSSEPFELVRSFDEIVNVVAHGKTVRFEIVHWREGEKRDFITCWFRDAATAAEAAARLPQTRTADFEQAVQDAANFGSTLEQVTPRTYVTPALVAINVLVFALMVADGAGLMQPDGAVHVRWGSNFAPYTAGGEWWRLLTCTFIHFGLAHLAFNMWALYDTGRMVERLYGPRHFLVLYVGAGLAGSMASLLWNPAVNSAGASGAIFGVFGALLVYMLNRDNRVPITVMNQHRMSTLVFIGYSLMNGFTHTGIDNAAHLGGLAAGAALGFLLARPLDAGQRATSDWSRIGRALIAATIVLGALVPLAGTRSEEQRIEMRYREDVAWFVKEEKEMIAEVVAWQKAAQLAGDDVRMADRLDNRVTMRWEIAAERLGRNRLSAGSRMYQHQALILKYAEGRRDAFRLISDSIRNRDERKATQAKSIFTQSNQALQELNQLIKSQSEKK